MRKLLEAVLFWGGFGLGAVGAFRNFGRIMQSAFRAIGSAENGSLHTLGESIARPLANTLVAGPNSADAINAARAAKEQGLQATIAYLSKPIEYSHEAIQHRDRYLALIEVIAEADVNASISLNLTQLGLRIRQELAQECLTDILAAAATHHIDICINMEESDTTVATLALFKEALNKNRDNVSLTIQANLYRSSSDISALIARNASVRLCRGGFIESAEFALQSPAEIEMNFLALARRLLSSDNTGQVAFATHNGETIQATISMARELAVDPETIEFELLYGIQPKMQLHLVSMGYKVRQYIPFGEDWQRWVLGRLAEREDGVKLLPETV